MVETPAQRVKAWLKASESLFETLHNPDFIHGAGSLGGSWHKLLRSDLIKILNQLDNMDRDCATLHALEAHGVDNWEGYSDAMRSLDEEEEND